MKLKLIALTLLLAACGSGSDDAAAGVASLEAAETTTETTVEPVAVEADTEEQLLEFAQCMRDQGIDMEDPTVDAEGNIGFGAFGGGDGQPPEGIREAALECEEFLDGIQLFGRDFDLTELEDMVLEFAQCMRDNGYDMPDPDFSSFGQPPADGEGNGGGRAGGPFGDIDFSDPDFITAQEACAEILDDFGRGPGTGAGRGGDGDA